MKFIVIAGTSTVLPFAVEVDAPTPEQAVAQAIPTEDVDMTLSPLLLVDLESGEAKRMYRDGEAWAVNDTAYRRDLGVMTPDEYFKE